MRNFYQGMRESMRWIVFSEDDDNRNAEGTATSGGRAAR
jgi:hypothetical protein